MDFATDSSALAPLNHSVVEASQPYVGQWSRLISTTNWEKGRIIVQWREALVAQELPVSEYSDEAWAQLVGGVTGQHVGRLRRVYQRFGHQQDSFVGLYWSHFQASIDWNDAEMWLEGAKQSGWSVSQMREQRWETLGRVESDRPQAADVVANETDEDAEPARSAPAPVTGEYGEVTGPVHDGPDFGDEPSDYARSDSSPGAEWTDESQSSAPPAELVRPFENLPDLPVDLADPFDSLKLAILHHKRDNWQAISAADLLHALDALKALITAPSEDAPF